MKTVYEMLTLRQPQHQNAKSTLQWITVGLLLFCATMAVLRLVKAGPHGLLTWLTLSALVVATLGFLVRAIRNPSEPNRFFVIMWSICTTIYAYAPFLHLLK